MRNVPKVVLRRLHETGRQESHPEAELLTAFAEQSLADFERARMVEHLAACSHCREVVAFALPASDTVAHAAPSRLLRRSWLTWPAFRWSAVTAGILLLTSLGVLQYKQGRKDKMVSTLVMRNEMQPAAQALAPSAATSEPQAGKQSNLGKTAPSNHRDIWLVDKSSGSSNAIFPAPHDMRNAERGSGIGGGAYIGSGSGGGNAPRAAATSSTGGLVGDASPSAPASKGAMKDAAAKPSPSSSSGAPVAVSGASQVVEVQSEAVSVQTADGQPQSQTHLPLEGRNLTSLDVVKAKEPVPPEVVSSAIPVSSPAQQTAAPALPRWAISPEGALQRSVDTGKTWQDVNVNQAEAAAASTQASTAEYREENAKKIKRTQPLKAMVFHAVSAIDAEVWAGGSGTLLFHSVDSGMHWTRVLPFEAGAVLSGDVTTIEFSDPQHGRIATSAGELWVTADDGLTWRRQR